MYRTAFVSKRFVSVLVAAVLASGFGEATALGRGPEEASQGAWSPFLSREGRFEVLMPGAPELKRVSRETDAGTIVQNQFVQMFGSRVVIVAYADLPDIPLQGADVERFLHDACTGAVRAIEGTEIGSRERVELDGYPGLTMDVVAGDGSLRLLGRVYVAGDRYYVLGYGLPPDEDAAEAERFFSSFAILDVY